MNWERYRGRGCTHCPRDSSLNGGNGQTEEHTHQNSHWLSGTNVLNQLCCFTGDKEKVWSASPQKPWLHFYCTAKRKQTLKRGGAWMDNELVWVGGLTDWWVDGWMEKMDGLDGETDEMVDGCTHGMHEWDGLADELDERKGCRMGCVGGLSG